MKKKIIVVFVLLLCFTPFCWAGIIQKPKKVVATGGSVPSANYYVNTDSSAGGDGTTNETTGDNRAFASLSEAEALNLDITASGLGITDFTIYCNGGQDAYSGSGPVFYGWTTDSTHRITVLGDYDSSGGNLALNTSQYYIDVTTSGSDQVILQLSSGYTTIKNIQGRITDTSGGCYGVRFRSTANLIDSCFFIAALSGSGMAHGILDSDGNTNSVKNTIVRDFINGTTWMAGITLLSGTMNVNNNTIYNCRRGCTNSGTFIVKNTIAMGATDGDFFGSYDAASTNNLSSDATAPGPDAGHYWRTQTATDIFENVSTNLHLKSGSNAIGNGADLDEDATLAVTEDIDGDPRDASAPDIGADEY